jgi:hypothetical protein
MVALKDPLEVELEVGLAHEAHIVAQEAQPEAVADDAIQVAVAAVEELLQQGVGRGGGVLLLVDVAGVGHQVQRHGGHKVVDGEGSAGGLEAGHRVGQAVAERLEQVP